MIKKFSHGDIVQMLHSSSANYGIILSFDIRRYKGEKYIVYRVYPMWDRVWRELRKPKIRTIAEHWLRKAKITKHDSLSAKAKSRFETLTYQELCSLNSVSSRMCEFGTKCCIIEHFK